MRWIAAFALALLAAGIFADVGPAPPKPDITVTFFKFGGGAADVSSVVYHCIADEQSMANWGSEAAFTCSGGKCTNGEWNFYKLSPCFYPENGYFTYMYEGAEKRSEDMGFNESGTYSVEINAGTGEVASRSRSSGCCAPTALIAAVFGIALVARKAEW